MVILRNTSNEISTALLYKLFQSGYFSKEIARISYGSAQPQLSMKVISEMELPMFTQEEEKQALAALKLLEINQNRLKQQILASKLLQEVLSQTIF
jgi:restriction endonuclease S subunit